MTDGDPVSWRGLIYGTPVVASDGTQVGTIREVLGSDAEDIFHGLRVELAGERDGNRDVMIPADALESLGTGDVRVARSAAEIRALPAYDEEATYHLASVGWLRKHLGWAKDSASDEEAG
jgi:uncharacterized protein YrrD